MHCRYCANEPADYRIKVKSLSRRLRGIKAELWMFDYEESFEQVAGPSDEGLDSEGNVTGFTKARGLFVEPAKEKPGV